MTDRLDDLLFSIGEEQNDRVDFDQMYADLLKMQKEEEKKRSIRRSRFVRYGAMAACAVALLGTSFALIWIMMAKGSKAWYEVYERYIFEIEQEEAEGLKIPERYRLGALCRPWEMNGNLFSKKAGRYSPSRLNITIGSVTLTAWLTVGLIHYAASVILYAEGPALCWQPLILALIPASFLAVLVTAARNMWGRSRSLVKP